MKTKNIGMEKSTISNKRILLELISEDGMNLQQASSILKKDREVVLAAVNKQAAALQFADKTLQSDIQIVVAALQDNAEASIAYVDKRLLKDTQFILDNLYGDFWSYMNDNNNIRKYFNTKTTVELLLSEYPDFFGDMAFSPCRQGNFRIASKRNENAKRISSECSAREYKNI